MGRKLEYWNYIEIQNQYYVNNINIVKQISSAEFVSQAHVNKHFISTTKFFFFCVMQMGKYLWFLTPPQSLSKCYATLVNPYDSIILTLKVKFWLKMIQLLVNLFSSCYSKEFILPGGQNAWHDYKSCPFIHSLTVSINFFIYIYFCNTSEITYLGKNSAH